MSAKVMVKGASAERYSVLMYNGWLWRRYMEVVQYNHEDVFMSI